MKFPIAIEPATENTAWGVVAPDLPGCFSAGDTAEEAFANAIEAIETHCEILAEDGASIPTPKPLSEHRYDAEYAEWIWGLVDVDTSRFEGKASQINITIPGNILTKVDEYAKAHGLSRSGFLVQAAQKAIA